MHNYNPANTEGTITTAVVVAVVFIIILFVIYLIPTIVAFRRACTSTVAITLINIFLGWTFVGYIGSLVWAIVGEGKLERKQKKEERKLREMQMQQQQIMMQQMIQMNANQMQNLNAMNNNMKNDATTDLKQE